MSALVGGTPGQRNFAPSTFETTNSAPLLLSGTWEYDASGSDLGTAWREPAFDDSAWSSGQGLFRAGNVTAPIGNPEAVPTVFSSGVDANGAVLAPGAADLYSLTQSAQSTPPLLDCGHSHPEPPHGRERAYPVDRTREPTPERRRRQLPLPHHLFACGYDATDGAHAYFCPTTG
jgi:hypothetical protein